MANKNNNVGYTGKTATDTGAYYAPYVPLTDEITESGWRASLQVLANYHSSAGPIETSALEHIQACMQLDWPGPYRVVVSGVYEEGPVFRTRYGDTPRRKRVELRLHFDNPADETWWHLKYD